MDLHNYLKTKFLLPHLAHEIKLIIWLFLLNYQQWHKYDKNQTSKYLQNIPSTIALLWGNIFFPKRS